MVSLNCEKDNFMDRRRKQLGGNQKKCANRNVKKNNHVMLMKHTCKYQESGLLIRQ